MVTNPARCAYSLSSSFEMSSTCPDSDCEECLDPSFRLDLDLSLADVAEEGRGGATVIGAALGAGPETLSVGVRDLALGA